MQIGNTGVIKDDPTVIRERLLNQAIEKVEGFTNLPSGIQNNLLDESNLVDIEKLFSPFSEITSEDEEEVDYEEEL